MLLVVKSGGKMLVASVSASIAPPCDHRIIVPQRKASSQAISSSTPLCGLQSPFCGRSDLTPAS
jgi:hypothetical protein